MSTAEERAAKRTDVMAQRARLRRVDTLANDLRGAPVPLTLVAEERIALAEYLLDLGYRRPLTKED